MRNKFTDLINQGVAQFEYTPISGDMPNTDPICRAYNNIFSLASDTHMSMLEDGRRVITGHIINTPKWELFINNCCYGAINFKPSGYWCMSDFLCKNSLTGRIGQLNGDVVYFVEMRDEGDDNICMNCPCVCHTTESKIPQQIHIITNSGNKLHVVECFQGNVYETCKRLNESTWIKGNNWVPSNNGIVGLVGDTVYVLNKDN
jgi:hypothetical protein